MPLKTILVPTDFSDYAAHAYSWALGLAADCKAQVILFHATPPLSHLAFPESVSYPELARMEGEMLAEAEQRVAAFRAKNGPSTVPVATRVTLGEAVGEICRLAEREQADLIVLGSHGRTGGAHVVLGSVAERVVRHASCPVLVARLPQQEKK